MTKLTSHLFEKPSRLLESHYSIEVLADILSQSKATMGARIKRGELTPCSETGKISVEQVKNHPEVQEMLNSPWDEEHATKPTRKYNLVELFAGGGGLAIGMEQAGLESILLNEMDKHACATLRHNRPDWNVIEGDISQVDFTQIKEDVDILTGGFPCQAFSYAGKSLGFEDTRGTLFFEMARAIKETQPKVFMAENVKALFTHDDGRTLETIKSVIDELGYELVEPRVLKAIFYKVPQRRERLILVGIRKDLADKVKFHWPSPYKRVMTLRDAFYAGELYGTDVLGSEGQSYPLRKKEIMSEVPQGGYWRDLPDELQREYMGGSYFLGGGKTGMARRLSLDEPSLTLTTSPAQKQTERCHPLETRPLQVREYARIQTFPDNWEFKGSKNAAYKQIGNAVPVNMARALGHTLVRLLNDIEVLETNPAQKKRNNMNNYNLGFMSNENFFNHVKDTVTKYRFSIDLNNFKKNLVDPIKMTFDSAVYQKDIEEVINDEISRQIDKSNTNHIGYFHQNIFKYIDPKWHVPTKGFDIVNETDSIYVEMKNKHNTMNSSSSRATYEKMARQLRTTPTATCYLVEVIAKESQNILWEPSIDGKKASNPNIKRLSIDKFYELVTGDDEAFIKVCNALRQAIEDALSESSSKKFTNTVLDELKISNPDLMANIFSMSFDKYQGFDKLDVD
ncbi:Eco47II family restriction endonuclease [Vibrio fluminensis]|uniref:Eco47II family restriction endonuclease n=1 Tax=Vibrio fluminensis TaxID=2783614 RepID=UPI001887BAC1|nr:Eco47II family restriction endonuclease [Vibrio fluminensis]